MNYYIINLDARKDRLEHMAEEFRKLGLSFKRVSAVNGKLPEVIEQSKKCEPGLNDLQMGPSAYACFQSHRKAWQAIIDSGDRFGVVLEDDLILSKNFDKIAAISFPENMDILRLEDNPFPVHLKKSGSQASPIGHMYKLASYAIGAGGYVVTAKTAQKLLESTGTPSFAVDEYLFNPVSPQFDTLRTYQIDPACVIQGHRVFGKRDGSDWVSTSNNTQVSERDQAKGQEIWLAGNKKSKLQRRLNRLKNVASSWASGTTYKNIKFDG